MIKGAIEAELPAELCDVPTGEALSPSIARDRDSARDG